MRNSEKHRGKRQALFHVSTRTPQRLGQTRMTSPCGPDTNLDTHHDLHFYRYVYPLASMSKRASGSSSSSSPNKKKKTSTSQRSLHTFFGASAPSTSSNGVSPSQHPRISIVSQTSPRLAGTKSLQSEVIDLVDSDEEEDNLLPDTSTRSAASPKPVATPSDTGATIAAQPLHGPIEYPVLSVDPALLDIDVCPWRPNTPAPYAFLAHALSTLSNTKSRIAIINTLTNTLRHMLRHHPPSVLPALYLLSNALSPPYMSVELGLGPSIISKAIQDVSGLTSAALKKLYNATGDAGDVAFEAKAKVRTLIPHPPLLVTSVYTSLLKIANAKGSGAAKAKQQIVEKLLVAAKGEEARFLVRTLAQHIRVGAVRTSLLTALARAAVLTPPADSSDSGASDIYYFDPSKIPATASAGSTKKAPSAEREELLETFGRAEALMRRTFVQHPNYDHIVAALLQGGLNGLHRVPLTVGAYLRRLTSRRRLILHFRYPAAPHSRISHEIAGGGL